MDIYDIVRRFLPETTFFLENRVYTTNLQSLSFLIKQYSRRRVSLNPKKYIYDNEVSYCLYNISFGDEILEVIMSYNDDFQRTLEERATTTASQLFNPLHRGTTISDSPGHLLWIADTVFKSNCVNYDLPFRDVSLLTNTVGEILYLDTMILYLITYSLYFVLILYYEHFRRDFPSSVPITYDSYRNFYFITAILVNQFNDFFVTYSSPVELSNEIISPMISLDRIPDKIGDSMKDLPDSYQYLKFSSLFDRNPEFRTILTYNFETDFFLEGSFKNIVLYSQEEASLSRLFRREEGVDRRRLFREQIFQRPPLRRSLSFPEGYRRELLLSNPSHQERISPVGVREATSEEVQQELRLPQRIISPSPEQTRTQRFGEASIQYSSPSHLDEVRISGPQGNSPEGQFDVPLVSSYNAPSSEWTRRSGSIPEESGEQRRTREKLRLEQIRPSIEEPEQIVNIEMVNNRCPICLSPIIVFQEKQYRLNAYFSNRCVPFHGIHQDCYKRELTSCPYDRRECVFFLVQAITLTSEEIIAIIRKNYEEN